MPEYPPDVFSGTAEFYARYRVPYPDDLLEDLCVRAGVTGAGRLLDLASGPGRVALPLSRRFSQVLAVDQEPEMIDVGRREADRLGLGNLRWRVERAEALRIEPESIELVTIGEAFHRLDRDATAALALDWLEPGGCLATLGCYGLTRGTEPWHQIMRDVLATWTNKQADAGARRPTRRYEGIVEDGETMSRAGFVQVENHQFSYSHEWTTGAIIGNLYSASGNLRGKLGDRRASFESELEGALMGYDARGRFKEVMRFGYTLGMKRGG